MGSSDISALRQPCVVNARERTEGSHELLAGDLLLMVPVVHGMDVRLGLVVFAEPVADGSSWSATPRDPGLVACGMALVLWQPWVERPGVKEGELYRSLGCRDESSRRRKVRSSVGRRARRALT